MRKMQRLPQEYYVADCQSMIRLGRGQAWKPADIVSMTTRCFKKSYLQLPFYDAVTSIEPSDSTGLGFEFYSVGMKFSVTVSYNFKLNLGRNVVYCSSLKHPLEVKWSLLSCSWKIVVLLLALLKLFILFWGLQKFLITISYWPYKVKMKIYSSIFKSSKVCIPTTAVFCRMWHQKLSMSAHADA